MTNLKEKVVSVSGLPDVLERCRQSHRSIVLSTGVFDLLHAGHIRHLTLAKSHGDVLIVLITPDAEVQKGEGRPVFNDQMRAQALAALEAVDYVVIAGLSQDYGLIEKIRPRYYAKGMNCSNPQHYSAQQLADETQAVQAVGGEMVFTEDMDFGSTGLINRHLPVLSRDSREFLHAFRKSHSLEGLVGWLDEIAPLRVLVVGETILDEYYYCRTLGKAGKEPILAAQFDSSELFAGGIVAVANHVAAVCRQVGLVSMLGENDPNEQFVFSKLAPNVQPFFKYMADSPTILKRRFLEMYPFQKLFELYCMNDQPSDASLAQFEAALVEQLPQADLVIVTDYGHGLCTPQVVSLLCEKSPFLAVNTQTNAANRGFNTVSKYPRADFLCVSEGELRLEVRNKKRDLRAIIEEVAQSMSCRQMIVTRGEQGTVGFDARLGFFECPAFGGRVQDRVGSGDAVLSIAAPLVFKGVPIEGVNFLANLAGAQAVATVGHREGLSRKKIIEQIAFLLA
ncbi:MAG: cytidyltransferase [Acidobacteria bacterium]|nr:cytidyltransferase [Acidobacteriota bacterium]